MNSFFFSYTLKIIIDLLVLISEDNVTYNRSNIYQKTYVLVNIFYAIALTSESTLVNV